MHDLHHTPPLSPERILAAGKMLVRPETNVRASPSGPGITECCAVQHPGQTEVQTRGTTETSTLMPAVRTSVPFSLGVVRESHGRLRWPSCAGFRPPPSLPPLGGGAGFPPPAGEGQGRGCHCARGAMARASRPRSRAVCIGRGAPRAWPSHVNISCWSRGVGKPGFPIPPPAGGFGRAQPSQEQHFHCGVVRREPHGRL